MCNSFLVGRKYLTRKSVLLQMFEAVNASISSWDPPRLIRPTNQAPVLLPDGSSRLMRWGFKRPGLKYPLNNTRTDNLGSGIWRTAWQERQRCLIPVNGYFEYTGPPGAKQAHLFHSPYESDEPSGGPWLWAAGIWERNAEAGDCFSMLMTESVGIVLPVHDRMPVLVTPEFFERYLEAETASDLQFPPQPLAVEAVENPLKRSPSLENGQPQASTAVQGELF